MLISIERVTTKTWNLDIDDRALRDAATAVYVGGPAEQRDGESREAWIDRLLASDAVLASLAVDYGDEDENVEEYTADVEDYDELNDEA